MGIKVVYVMTHDSIGVGEDGPTHQPVEHVAALRAIPNLLVLRPADAVEAMECWKIALTDGRPCVMVLPVRARRIFAMTIPSSGLHMAAISTPVLRQASVR